MLSSCEFGLFGVMSLALIGCTSHIYIIILLCDLLRWDAEAERRLRSLDGHNARVGALSWNQHWLSSGGRDSQIIQHDVRSRNHIVSTYVGHTQEVGVVTFIRCSLACLIQISSILN